MTTSTPRYSIFIGDLSAYCTEEEIHDEFVRFGEIVEVRIKRSKETGKPLLYGFIEFNSASSAASAIKEMNGKVFKGRALRVRWATSRGGSISSKRVKPGGATHGYDEKTLVDPDETLQVEPAIHVKFYAFDAKIIVTEEALRELFTSDGNAVVDCTIKHCTLDQEQRVSGYGFVSFVRNNHGVQAALSLSKKFEDVQINRVHLKCEPSRSLTTYLRQQHVQHLLEMQQQQQQQMMQMQQLQQVPSWGLSMLQTPLMTQGGLITGLESHNQLADMYSNNRDMNINNNFLDQRLPLQQHQQYFQPDAVPMSSSAMQQVPQQVPLPSLQQPNVPMHIHHNHDQKSTIAAQHHMTPSLLADGPVLTSDMQPPYYYSHRG